jgi:hypothetical protein
VNGSNDDTDGADAEASVRPSDLTSAEKWDRLKSESGVLSPSMDKLMKLTGLRVVKEAAVQLFRSAIKLSLMDPEDRKNNMPVLNFVFMGNPGTGKTVVARLFAEILHDSKLRAGKKMVECNAQEVKDDGIDQFRKLIQSALDGMLPVFLDSELSSF